MKSHCAGWVLALVVLGVFVTQPVQAQMQEDATVRDAINVFHEIMAIPADGIPRGMLKDAEGVAIIPGVLKGSFIVGARFGRGVLVIRDQQQGWHAPVFITLTGGNVGWQVGVQSTDVILVFKTRKSIDGILNGKFTIGADAAAAAGPVGRQASAATDGRFQAEIYSYSRSRGLFAGVSIDGSVIQIDSIANATYYRPTAPGAPVAIPPAADQLTRLIWQATETPVAANPDPAAAAGSTVPLAQQHGKDEATAVRDELARFAPQMFELLDNNWQNYLALPAEVFNGTGHPNPETLTACLDRYETIRRDPRYQRLAERPEFQSTYGLLKHYQQALNRDEQHLDLPAPPPFELR